MNNLPKPLIALISIVSAFGLAAGARAEGDVAPPRGELVARTPDLEIRSASVRYLRDLDLLVFEQRVRGRAGATVPTQRGTLDGAPVLGYVFPTTLSSTDIGFGEVEGVVALAVTAHPDFDDTPLWDEDGDGAYDDDGVVFHSHWVVLAPDTRVAGGLAARSLPDLEAATVPPTHPGMPIYLDSPGFSVVLDGDALRVLVPKARVGGRRDFRFDAVSAYMEVATTGDRPMLGVHHVYGVLSGDLSLPYEVTTP